MSLQPVDSFTQAVANALAIQGYQIPVFALREALSVASRTPGVDARLSVDPDRQACAPVAATDVVRWSVPAAIMDDNGVYVRRFDATGYFEQAMRRYRRWPPRTFATAARQTG